MSNGRQMSSLSHEQPERSVGTRAELPSVGGQRAAIADTVAGWAVAWKRFCAVALASVAVLSAPAVVSAADVLSVDEVRAVITAARPELVVQSVTQDPASSLFTVSLAGGQIVYVTQDGKHLLAGDLYRIKPGELINETELLRGQSRKQLMAGVRESDMVVFAPRGEVKAVVDVFTDVDCGYCRKLHQEMAQLNDFGIKVRYLAYPRAGIGTATYDKIVSAWCARDRNKAMTTLKAGGKVEPRTCDNPVAAQYALGREVGVSGTPTLVLETGEVIPGYLQASQLAARLGLIDSRPTVTVGGR